MPDRPRYMISVAADLVGMHPQTLRIYENKGLVRPQRTPGGTRLYSEDDIERLRIIQRLTTEVGLNLAGVELVLRLEDELRRSQRQIDTLQRRLKTYTVKIKPGVKDGTRIRLKGKGEAGENGGSPGDLIVVTRVDPSPVYERRGDDLVVQVPVSYPTATLGGSVEVPTPEGPVSLKIPAGSEDGKLIRIKGRGAPKLNGSGKGDVLARVRIEVPKRVNKKERELLEELKKAGG